MKKKFTRGLTVVILSICTMNGCVHQTDIPIVLEKAEESLKAPEQSWEESGDENKKAGEQNGTIKELTQVPEIYRTEIQEENITITADVNVEVPETDKIPLMEVQYSPYTEEELKTVQEILAEELDIAEWLDSSQTYQSPDHVYVLSLKMGIGQETPIIWLSYHGISDRTIGDDGQENLSGFSMTEEDKNQIQKEMEKKSEDLLQKMGLEDFYLEDVRWRELNVSNHYSWSSSEQWGLRLYYRRKIGDMPIINSKRGTNFSEPTTQYVEILYSEDGTLLEVKDIGREQIGDTLGYTGFLLPFLSVSQIFEQCMKTLEMDTGTKSHIYLTVTEVKLAYQIEYENQDLAASETGSRKGKLVPVWAFYGIAERGYQNQDGTEAEIPRTLLSGGKKVLFLTVNAEDGTIYK